MDEVKRIEKEKVKDIPPVPIKTYKWEEIRREKKKGRYPYTHLRKGPYNEEIDPAEFRMDTLRTSKSASTLEKSSSGVDIQDVTGKEVNSGGKDYLDVYNEGIVETADSSNEDNVSQYLDKDEDAPIIMEHIEVPGPSKKEEKMDVDDDREEQRAKSEEPKRKRKLSIESSYSRISLSKLGVMKKLREAKEKLKLPKFNFSKSESKLDIPKKSKKEDKKEKTGKKVLQAYFEPKKHDTPVYIHIPLKPPPGETDEFSYLEFEDSKAEPSTSVAPSTPEKTEQENINGVQQPNGKEGVQFIILTAPSDDETLENHGSPDTPSSETGKKFFETVKLKDLKTLAKECVDEITPDMPIEGIIFEDVIQVEYVDEHNRSLGTTERSNILEITEENLPKIEKQLSQRNLAKELQKDIASSMDSLHHIARQNTLKKLKQQQKSKSNEALKKARDFPKKTQEAPELTISPPPITKPDEEQSKLAESVQEVEKMDAVETDVVANIDKVKSEKDEEIKIDKSEETESKTVETAEKKEIQKQPDAEAATKVKTEAMYDEEDGLKLSETAVQMINEELAKEQLPKTNEEQLKAAAAKPTSVKKKVSFKRRSKQEDPDGVYEDVRVTSDNKKVNGKEQQTKELKVMEPSQSMSAEEEKTYLDDKIMKTTSLEEDYNKWSKLTDHEYEPVNPPAEVESQQPPAPEVPPNDASVKRTSSKQSKKSPSNSIRISLKGEDVVQNEEDIESGDALTVEEMQARIEDQFFNKESPSSQPADLPVNTTSVQLTTDNKENVPQESQAKKIQGAFRAQAEKLRTKMKNIKKPNIHMPQRPNFEKFKIQKPNITMPKIPDQMRVNLPSFTLPKRGSRTEKRPVKQYSTESNVGDSKKKLFDFSTYPRIFKRKKKPDDFDNDEFDISATVPRSTKTSKGRQRNSEKTKESEKKKKSPDVIRIPLHSEESMDKDENDMSSHRRYEEENIDMDDAYLKESQQMNVASAIHASDFNRNRWNHGSFHGHNPNETENNENEIKDVTMDNEIDRPQTSPEPELEIEMDSEQIQSDMRSVSSSGDVHGPGVLEKINSDEYFMQMGGNYLSAEIREAFKQPTNPLAKLQADDSFEREFDISDQSIQDVPKRKPIRKPKRKKTPNVSRERIPYDQESEQEEYPEPYNEQPARPTRRSKQKKKTDDDKPPYQETIFVQDPQFEIMRKAASDNILLVDRGDNNGFRDGHFRQEYPKLYENEKMQGIDQPNIFISDPYQKRGFRYHEDDNQNLGSYEKETPDAPPRRQRSLRSLGSEHDSIIDEYNLPKQDISQNIEVNKLEYEYIIPTPEEPPIRPTRTKSRTRSQSRTTDQPEDELPPTLEPETPCIEEPCVQQVCDYMGYAVIDKNRHREPPLPPPTRKKRSNTKAETKFFTVPRPLKEEVPKRPVRNYSTLVPKSQRPPSNLSEEEKENVDIGQYIEIEDEDEHSRLQSGEIVQKMKGRPLPAPPRPPRKCKDLDKDSPFKDITHENNLDEEEPTKMKLEEAEASVQTEPLPDDVVCEELVEEKGDKIIIPTTSKFHPPITEFENIETVTHGALVVTPIPEDFQEGPITSFSRSTERIITVRREYDEDDSKTPEDFRTLRDPQPKIIERIVERPAQGSPEIELLRAQKLQVSDLDVDRLMVNELLASKIKVSEIDGETISVAEINPKSGNLMIGGLELPVSLIQDIIEKIRNSQIPTEIQRESAGENRDKILIEGKDPSAHPEFFTDDSKNADVPSGKSQQPQEPHEPFKEDLPPNLPTKTHEDIVPSKEEDEPSKRISPDPEKNILFEPDSELSPTTLKNTIEYLDNLIIEESSKSDLENNAKREKQSDLEAMPDSKPEVFTTEVSTKVKSITLPPIDPYSEEEHESIDLQEIPLLIPDTSEEEKLIEELKITSSEQKKTPFEEEIGQPPTRPPRQSDIHRLQQSHEEIFIPSQIIENSHNIILGDSTPPPRPPDPEERLYLRSQPPPSFYVLRTPALDGFVDEDIPLPPRRKRPQRQPSQSSSEEALRTTPRSRRHRTPEPSIPQLAGQLTRACVLAGERAFKRLVKHVTMNVLRNADGKQDLHVMILILLVLIAGLILLGNGGSPIVHHYHWEYFNPPRDL